MIKTKKISICGVVLLLMSTTIVAELSSITDSDGYSCMGIDKSKRQTETAALQDAKRNAVEFSQTYIQSESLMQNFELKKDLVQAFAKANVKVIEVLNEQWQAPAEGDCYNIRIKAEVRPEPVDMDQVRKRHALSEDPTAPLNVTLWSNQDSYLEGEPLIIYIKGNKPFYGRLIYTDANLTPLQILPNPYRKDAFFQGGVVYQIPEAADKFDLTVQSPFGSEKLTIYASTAPLGEIEKADVGPVYQVQEEEFVVAAKSRGISVDLATPESRKKVIAEFDETQVTITTQSGAPLNKPQ